MAKVGYAIMAVILLSGVFSFWQDIGSNEPAMGTSRRTYAQRWVAS